MGGAATDLEVYIPTISAGSSLWLQVPDTSEEVKTSALRFLANMAQLKPTMASLPIAQKIVDSYYCRFVPKETIKQWMLFLLGNAAAQENLIFLSVCVSFSNVNVSMKELETTKLCLQLLARISEEKDTGVRLTFDVCMCVCIYMHVCECMCMHWHALYYYYDNLCFFITGQAIAFGVTCGPSNDDVWCWRRRS